MMNDPSGYDFVVPPSPPSFGIEDACNAPRKAALALSTSFVFFFGVLPSCDEPSSNSFKLSELLIIGSLFANSDRIGSL